MIQMDNTKTMNGGIYVTYTKKIVFGLILLLLAAFAVYSCIMVFGARRRVPERAKLVIGWSDTWEKDLRLGGIV